MRVAPASAGKIGLSRPMSISPFLRAIAQFSVHSMAPGQRDYNAIRPSVPDFTLSHPPIGPWSQLTAMQKNVRLMVSTIPAYGDRVMPICAWLLSSLLVLQTNGGPSDPVTVRLPLLVPPHRQVPSCRRPPRPPPQPSRELPPQAERRFSTRPIRQPPQTVRFLPVRPTICPIGPFSRPPRRSRPDGPLPRNSWLMPLPCRQVIRSAAGRFRFCR